MHLYWAPDILCRYLWVAYTVAYQSFTKAIDATIRSNETEHSFSKTHSGAPTGSHWSSSITRRSTVVSG